MGENYALLHKTSPTQDLSDLRKFVESELDSLHTEMDEIRHEWETHRHVCSPVSASTSHTATAVHGLKVPKPAMYNGVRNATTVENFLFCLEQDFEAMGDDLARISNAPTFFRDAAQLWWRRKHAEREKGLLVRYQYMGTVQVRAAETLCPSQCGLGGKRQAATVEAKW